MKRSLLFMVLIVVTATIMFVKCNYAENSVDQLKMQKMIAIQQSLDKPISYFGKVADQQNTPIANANVKIQIGQASGVNTKLFSTDNNGIFEISGINGSDFLITEINAPTYEFLDSNNENTGYENDGSKVIDKNNPIVFTMRKKEPPTVVVRGDISVTFDKNDKYYEVDLIEMIDEKPNGLNRYHGSYAHADLKTRFEHSTVDDSYVFILETPDSDSGIIAQDQMLYIPPETGYKTPYRITVPAGQKTTTYLYIKTRGGQVYSRLNIDFCTENGKVYWAAKVATNPLGERNLDYDETKFSEYLNQKIVNRKKMGQ